jgi:hypothetical protein
VRWLRGAAYSRFLFLEFGVSAFVFVRKCYSHRPIERDDLKN